MRILIIADFFNWNRVKIRYCDGASFSGDSQHEVSKSNQSSINPKGVSRSSSWQIPVFANPSYCFLGTVSCL